jgi:transposase-like protein
MGGRKQFTPEFKREAVQLLESGSRPASEIARELRIARNSSTSGRPNTAPVGLERFRDPVPARSGRLRSLG